jgi:hypothetical protein
VPISSRTDRLRRGCGFDYSYFADMHIRHRAGGSSIALLRPPSHFRTDDLAALLCSTGQDYLDTPAAAVGIDLSRSESERDAVAHGNADDTAAGTVADTGASETALGQTAGQIVGRILAAGQVSLVGSKEDRVVGIAWNRQLMLALEPSPVPPVWKRRKA